MANTFFKGDIITGREHNSYAITDETCLMIVTGVNENDMAVLILTHNYEMENGDTVRTYTVNADETEFRHTTIGKFMENYYNRLIPKAFKKYLQHDMMRMNFVPNIGWDQRKNIGDIEWVPIYSQGECVIPINFPSYKNEYLFKAGTRCTIKLITNINGDSKYNYKLTDGNDTWYYNAQDFVSEQEYDRYLHMSPDSRTISPATTTKINNNPFLSEDDIKQLKETEVITPQNIRNEAENLLSTIGWDTGNVQNVLTSSTSKKQPLINFFRKSPYWDEERQAVVRKEEVFTREVDCGKVDAIYLQITDICEKIAEKNNENKSLFYNTEEIKNYIERYSRIKRHIASLSDAMGIWKSSISIEIKGHKYTYREAEQEIDYWEKLLNNIERSKIYFAGYLISEDLNNKLCFVRRCMSRMEGYHEQVINETMAKRLNDTACSYGFDLKLREGMKMAKILEKIAKVSGINQYKDIREVESTTQDGAVIKKNVDFGWNKIRAEYGDAISPLKYTRTCVISLNPVDFFCASNGTSWSSCYTIDPKGCVFYSTNNAYSGEYMAGTLSYMLDGSTIQMYTINEEKYEPVVGIDKNAYELYPKERRQWFHLAPDFLSFIGSRCYPDGRDGGEKNIASQMVAIFKKTLAEIYKVNTDELKYTEEFIDYSYEGEKIDSSDMMGYKDFYEYRDPRMYIYQNNGKNNKFSPIKIGEMPVGIDTYDELEEHNTIAYNQTYWDFYSEYTCNECGCGISNRDVDNGNYEYTYSRYDFDDLGQHIYCSENCICQRHTRVVGYADMEYAWVDDDRCVELANGDYCYDDCGSLIAATDETGDTVWYFGSYDAENDGCVNIDGEWYTSDAYGVCSVCGECVPLDEFDEEHELCSNCMDTIAEEVEEEVA